MNLTCQPVPPDSGGSEDLEPDLFGEGDASTAPADAAAAPDDAASAGDAAAIGDLAGAVDMGASAADGAPQDMRDSDGAGVDFAVSD